LANSLTEGTIVLAGPVVAIDSKLRNHPRVVLAGVLGYEELPQLASRSRVLVMPYRRMPATEAMQPLKFKEYMATGLPCVVSPLPAVAGWNDCVDIVADGDGFTRRVMMRLQEGTSESQRAARKRLGDESWEAKARQFAKVLEATLANPAGTTRFT
jgi:glycosyltransferase involved in cell wall biosynthesis